MRAYYFLIKTSSECLEDEKDGLLVSGLYTKK